MQRIIGEDGKPQMVKINAKGDGVDAVKNDITVGRYDVVMDSGPSYETMREEGSEAMLELSSSPSLGPLLAKVAPDLILRSMDVQYAEEIADRLAAQTPDGLQKIMESLPANAKAVVQSLAQENGQLKQALQAAQMEAKYGITKAHLAAEVKAHDVEESNKTKRLDTAVRSHTALAVEEIRAGASLMNTHAEAAHHEREADKMIANADREEGAA